MDVVFVVSLEKKKSMTSPTRIKILLLSFSKSSVRLFLRYLVGLVVGIIPLGSGLLLLMLFNSDTDGAWIISISIFMLALPSIPAWHVLNEAIRLSNFEVKHREHITAFAVASIVMVLALFHRMTNLMTSIEFSISVCLFIFLAVLNSYLYVMLCRRFLPNIGC
tara:strand:- start:372 stop:863 length:492 start_codon:yes stop_codon:yes gene_type:complete